MEFDVSNGRDIFAQYKGGAENFALMSDGFIRSTSGWVRRHASIPLGDIAANSDAYTFPLLRAKHDITIQSVDLGVDTNIGADASNYQTIYLENSGHSTDLSSMTSAAAWTAHVPKAFSSLDSGSSILRAGSTLSLRMVKTASGKAMSGLVVSISYTINQVQTTVGSGSEDDNVLRVINDVGTAGLIIHDHTSRDHVVVKNKGVEKFRINLNGKMIGAAADAYFYHPVNVGTIVAADGAAKKCVLIKPHCTIKVENIYVGANSDCAADSDTAFMQVLAKDNSGNILVSDFIHGPYQGGLALTKGLLYDMGEVNPEYAEITSSEQLQLEFVATGSPSDIPGLTAVVAFRKLT
jgi:hypothetical protein